MNESTNILKKRYITLDLIKIIAAYMVVFIHVSFPGHFGKVIVCLARFAVPLFFIISGYFSYSKIESCDIYRLRRKIESTGILFFGSIIFYVLAISCVIRKPERIGNWLANGSSLDALQNFIVWNELPMKEMEHLWFLGALLYCYICAYIFCRKKAIMKILPTLLTVNFLLGECKGIFGISEIPIYITRNAWFCGLPCFAIGYNIRGKIEFQEIHILAKTRLLLVLIFVSEFLVLVEAKFVGISDLYFFSMVAAVLIFLYGILASHNFGCFAWNLRKIHSSIIYIMHPFFAVILRIAIEKTGFNANTLLAFFPIMICLIATLFSVFAGIVMDKMSSFLGRGNR